MGEELIEKYHKKRERACATSAAKQAPTGANEMTPEEKNIINKERKQIKGFIDCIRTENKALSKRLASMISLIGSARQSQLAIELILDKFEGKLGKK